MTSTHPLSFQRFFHWLALLACGLLLAACGGGGGNPGTTGTGAGTGGTGTVTNPTTPTVTVSLQNASGAAASTLSVATPLTARALVLDATGKPVAGQIVEFSASKLLTTFRDPALASGGTAVFAVATNSAGVASAAMAPATLSSAGTDEVVATVSLAGTSYTGKQALIVNATPLTLSALTLSPASITAYNSSIITLDVLAGGAKYTAVSKDVSFSSPCVTAGKATLAAKIPTSNGSVTAVYRDQGCGNTDLVTASVDGVTASATLTIAAPLAASIKFTSATPTDRSIVIKGQGGITRTETATLKFQVIDTFGNPLPGKNVTFSTVAPATDVVINKIHDSTDANGEVITTVNSGSNPNTFRVTATIDGSTISTSSDSIVVTTGVIVQKAFSLSVAADNVEGWTYDSGPTTPATTVSLLIADLGGNPVADGTPVVFQTNMGSVGSSSKGACNTVNGGCSVDFRTQDPRVPTVKNSPFTPCNKFGVGGLDTDGSSMDDSTRPGLATICASSTDGANTIYKKIALFMSGSVASNVFLYTGGSTTKLSSDPLSAVTDLGNVAANDSRVFNLLVSDVNLNPMPFGTKVEITSINNGSAVGVGPSTVGNIFPHAGATIFASGTPVGAALDGNQGTIHTVTIGSAQPKPCLGALVATFNIAISTPVFGARPVTTTSYPFKVTFTCP
jgi:hypothetical protein